MANHTDANNHSLAEAGAAERDVFGRMLHNPAEAFGRLLFSTAEAFSDLAVQRWLKQNMTVKQLIVQLDSMFHSYIVNEWEPAARKKLEASLEVHCHSLESLGPQTVGSC